MKAKRQSTVEPVFGTLTQFMGLRKVNTIGLRQADKCMHMSAIAYNLKKYLKFITNKAKSGATNLAFIYYKKNRLSKLYSSLLRNLIFHPTLWNLKIKTAKSDLY